MIALMTGLAGCENVDCTLNNVVLCHFSFYDAETGESVALLDTLTITAEGTDSVLLNRAVGKKDVSVPLSYYQERDTLNFIITTEEDGVIRSSIIIEKSGQVHFESPDCPTTMFHTLRDVRVYSGEVMDSVAITRKEVNYLQDENIRIFVRTRSN